MTDDGISEIEKNSKLIQKIYNSDSFKKAYESFSEVIEYFSTIDYNFAYDYVSDNDIECWYHIRIADATSFSEADKYYKELLATGEEGHLIKLRT